MKAKQVRDILWTEWPEYNYQLDAPQFRFYSLYKRHPNAQELYATHLDLLREEQEKEQEQQRLRNKCKPVWREICKYRVRWFESICKFISYKYARHIKWSLYESPADIQRRLWFNCFEEHILDEWLLGEFVQYIKDNKKDLRYYRPNYTDYSSQAYNNSSDDL